MEIHGHCICAQNALSCLKKHVVNLTSKTINAELICRKVKKNNRFDNIWLSVQLFGIAEAFILTMLGCFVYF